MRGISNLFMIVAVVAVTLGMIWGIEMSATQNHSMAPAHAHLNLIGWVTMALFAVYYHLVPAAGEKTLAKVHFGVATLGLVLIVPGIVMALNRSGEALAKAGSVLTLLSMLIFLWTVARNARVRA
jgi:cbb3-type cytochrome oxidase subunit 1